MPEHITPVKYQNMEKHAAISVEISQFQKEVHFQITSKTPHFGTQQRRGWVGEKWNNTNISHIICFKKKGTGRLATFQYQCKLP